MSERKNGILFKHDMTGSHWSRISGCGSIYDLESVDRYEILTWMIDHGILDLHGIVEDETIDSAYGGVRTRLNRMNGIGC